MKRKLLFLMTLFISAFAFNAKAQTDVTSTHLTNADFSLDTPIATNLKGYGKDMGTSATLYGFQPVTGWTSTVVSGDNSNASYPNSGMGCAVFAYGSSYQVQGNSKTPPTAGPDGSPGNCLAFFGVWGCGGYYYQDVTFPAGEYTINIPVYNQSGTSTTTTYFGFIPNSGTSQTMATPTSTGSWITLTKTFTLATETEGKICVGYKSNGSGSGANPMLFIDKVEIIYTPVVIKDDLAVALAYATRINQTLSSSALTSAISTAQGVYDSTTASQDDVNNALASLETATAQALAASGLTDLTFVFQNSDFSSTDGWTPVISGQYRDYNNGLIGSALASYAASTIDATHLRTDYYLANQCRWNTNYSSWTQSVFVVPAGNYRLTFDVENTNTSTTAATYENRFYVTVGGTTYTDESTEWMSGATDWTSHTISFTLSEPSEIYLSLGYGTGSNNFGTANTPVLYTSHLNLSLVSDDEVLAAARAAWEQALQAAIDATNDGANDNVTGAEYTEISAEIAKEEPTDLEGYEAATQALIDATSAFIAAAPSYDALINEISKAASLGVSTTDAQDVADAETTTAADAVAATKNLKVAEYIYVTSVYQYGVELGTWQEEGPTGSLDTQHWSDTQREYLEQSSEAWNQSAWEIKYKQDITLPAGNYVFKVAGRKAAGDGVTMSLIVRNGETVLGSVSDFPEGDTGLGINTDGETDYDPSHTYANGNAGRGWEWRYVKFTLSEQTTVNVAVEAKATIAHQWVSFCDATVQTDDEAGFALIAYNVALADAQTILADENYANVTGYERYMLESLVEYDKDLDKTNKGDIETATSNLLVAITDFEEAKPAFDNLATAINDAQAINTTANVGTGVFQIPESAVEALNDAINAAQVVAGYTTASEAVDKTQNLTDAVSAYQNAELNAPAADDHFKIVLVADNGDYAWNENAITFIANGRGDAGLYNIQYKPQNDAYAQAFTFTKSSGNDYTLSMVDEDGNTRYITTGIPYSGNKYQIRTSTNADDAALFTVKPTNTGGIFNLYNIEAERNVGSQDEGVYTVEQNNGFRFDVVNKASVDLAISADVKYATRVFPFVPTLPEGMVAYTCSSEEGDELDLVETTDLKPNVPYILFADEGVASTVLEGWGLGKGEEAVTFGHLTGNYSDENMIVPMNSYVLQNKEGRVAFYRVTEDVFEEVYVSKYRCYLTASEGAAKVLNLNVGEATAIDAIEALTSGTAEIYNASGIRVNSLEKGLNIIRTSDGKIKKVLVK